MGNLSRMVWPVLLAGGLWPLVGCVVPQPRGLGQQLYVTEPTTRRNYFLYFPKEYVELDEASRAQRRWPLVVTFHGMKPYDTAPMQALEWQQEADRYGFIVIAPELLAFDFIFGEFPLHTINRAFKSDELATLAILDHVFQTTPADPGNVLSTGFSSGGYMAHYMLNRHPDRFTCLAVRQGNFSPNVLDSTWTSQSIYHPVLVLSTQYDFPVCKEESIESIRWYESHGYKNFAWVNIRSRTHERTPDLAADFFARVVGTPPNYPPEVLVQRQAIDGNPAGLALLAGKVSQIEKPPGMTVAGDARQPAVSRPLTQRRPVLVAVTNSAATPATTPVVETPAPEDLAASGEPTPRRGTGAVRPPRGFSPVGIRVSATLGFEPLLLTYSADCPSDWHRTARFVWLLDGQKIGEDINGQRTIAQPGDHTLTLLVTTKEGASHQAARKIRVLRSLEASNEAPASHDP